MKILTKYDERLEYRFLWGRLPNSLRRAIDAAKYTFYERARKIPPMPGKLPVADEFIQLGEHVYQIQFSLGKLLQDDAEEEPVQELRVLRIHLVPGLHGIR